VSASLLALGSAVAYGLADFAGGFSSKHRSAWAVVCWSQIIGLPVLAVGLLVIPSTAVEPADLVFGALAGVAGVIGLNLLYKALASGVMSVVAPTSAASGAVFSLTVGLVRGETLGVWQVAGIGLAMVAVVLVTWQRNVGPVDRRPIWMAMAAGAFFGGFFAAMSFTHEAAGLWPLVPARASSIALSLVLAGSDRWPPVKDRFAWILVTGLLDMLANTLVVLAAQRGQLSVVAVIGSLYPVFTVTAAILYLKERPLPVQVVGAVLGFGAILLLA
jgi:drug/metabolite transporter (DMT)-like permease